ncbi:MAG: hypothetical protein GXO89_12195 [Chlorobi bacterium]|nr:hypothetical protein [Chlorobiota bacterium]
METEKIIILILSSSLLSAGLTGFITWFIKQNEYKKEINKRFIDRRLNAYQDIELMLRPMYWVIGDTTKGYKYHLFLMDSKHYSSFILGFGRAMHATMWYSDEMRKILSKINEFILLNSDFMPLNPEKSFLNKEFVTDERIRIAVGFYTQINDLKKEIENQMIIDYARMHKIELLKLKR